ncbi:MAG: hotdog fold thioesterase [Saprospiraceae bacterium]|nr:hotdog fold thioesterase [Saprospiraceae bacterium]
MIWKQAAELDLLNKVKKNTMVDHLGIKFTEIGDDYLDATMPVDHRTVQPDGVLHGGASVALAETVGSMASFLCIDDIKRFNVVGMEVHASHLRGVYGGNVIARARPVKIGRKVHVWNIEIVQQEKLICVSRLTTMVIETRNPS